MTYEKTMLFFHGDETYGRVGCGLRTMPVAVGRKWARIKLLSGRSVRIRKSTLEILKTRAAKHMGVAP